MKPKTLLLILVIGAVAAAGGYLAGQHSHSPAAGSAKKTLYTCGMHPQVIQDHPGNCPICGMKLTPIRGQAGGTTTISIDPVTVQNMGIRSELVTRGPLRRAVRTVATINFDETTLVDVTTKFNGWIEKLYVDATGQQVHRDDPLFEIYSPELYSAQIEYLQALKTGPVGDNSLLETARLKLKYYDINDAQIAELEKSREPTKTLKISAPADGFVMEKTAVEGMMVQSGMKLYRVADLGIVWVYAQVYEQDLPFVKLGQEAVMNLSYLSDRKFRGRVTYIYPSLDEQTRTARVRMEFHNPGYYLKPGMFASVELTTELAPDALLVPDLAVLRSGEQNTVFVALEGGKFDPRKVVLGPRGEGYRYAVLSGLAEGERVVTSGQFMLDSESQLREAIQKMQEPVAATSTAVEPAMAAAAGGQAVGANEMAPDSAVASRVTYICPMPEHVSIEYEHPGSCPICGMKLVPVSAELLAQIHPGGTIKYYTCPMPEHADVHVDAAGKCPRCAMTLIPVMDLPPTTSSANPLAPVADPTHGWLDKLYTCPMAIHADVVSEEPGKCPKCDMNLVKAATVPHGQTAVKNWLATHPDEAGHQH